MSLIMHFYVYSLIYKYLPCDLQPQSCVSSTRKFLFYCVRIHIPQNLYNPDQNSSLYSQMIYDHIFFDPKSDHIFEVFGYSLGLYFVSACIWPFSTYFKESKVLESAVSLLTIELDRPQK